MNTYVVDIQYFRGNSKNLILKSFAYAKLFDSAIEHFVFKPPHNFEDLNLVRKYEARHVTKNYHKLQWDDGFIDYSYIPLVLRSVLRQADEVLVKGSEKVQYLNYILRRNVCFNVEDLDCPKLSTLKMCHGFFDTTPVSTQNVRAIMHWVSILYSKSIDFIDEAIAKYNKTGLFSLDKREKFFLPVSFLIEKCSPCLLQHELKNLAPHIVNNTNFRNYVFENVSLDEVDARLETEID